MAQRKNTNNAKIDIFQDSKDPLLPIFFMSLLSMCKQKSTRLDFWVWVFSCSLYPLIIILLSMQLVPCSTDSATWRHSLIPQIQFNSQKCLCHPVHNVSRASLSFAPTGAKKSWGVMFFAQAVICDSYFTGRCLASRFMKQQVTVEMMTMPTNRADDTPITSGISRRSAAGNGRESHLLK